MSGRVTLLESGAAPGRALVPLVWCMIGLARVLVRLSPQRLCRILRRASRGARPATAAEALRARDAVVALSMQCAGPRCLQRSVATALLCRTFGTWPEWCVGVRTLPFQAHAWVAVDGTPVGEEINDLAYFHVLLRIPPQDEP